MGTPKRARWTGSAVVLVLVLGTTGIGVAAPPPGGGAPDPSFGGGDGIVDLPSESAAVLDDARIYGVAVAPDGSIRVGWDGAATGVTKYSASGVLDTTFGEGGAASPVFSPGRPAVGSDGSTFVAGEGEVVKLDPAGNPDTSFGTGGTAAAPAGPGSDVLLRPGGGLLVAGGGDLHALTEGGSLDPAFTYGTDVYAQRADVLADGRIAVGSDGGDDLVVLDPTGALAIGVGADPMAPGALDIDITTHGDRVGDLVARPGGGLIAVVGYAEGNPDAHGLFAVAFTSAGLRDETYGVGGVVDLQQGDPDCCSIFQVARPVIDPTGRLTISLPTASHFDSKVLRFDPSGELDPTFDGDGRRYVGEAPGPPPLALAADGGLFLASPNDASTGWILRLRADGTDATEFDGDGFLPIGLPVPGALEAQSIVAQADGSTIVLRAPGYSHVAGSRLTRLHPDGSPDPSFGDSGEVLLTAREDATGLAALAVDPLDRIYAAHGQSADRWSVSRWLADGAPDPAWGDGGRAELPFVETMFLRWFRISPLPDGGLAVAGVFTYPFTGSGACCGPSYVTVVHLRADGSPDPGYTPPRLEFDEQATTGGDLALLPDGSTVIGLGTSVQRFTPTGVVDPAWIGHTLGAGGSCRSLRLAPWRHGGVLILEDPGCSNPPAPTIVALDAHGHPDPLIPVPVPIAGPPGDSLHTFEVDSAGRIVIGLSSAAAPTAIRLLADGSADPGFAGATGGWLAAVDAQDRALTIDSTGRLVTRLLAGAPPAPLPVSLPISPLTVRGAYTRTVGDFDGDGTQDVLWYAPGSTPDGIWYGRHTGGFTMRPLTINLPYQPVAGDFDGDGRTDLFFYGTGSRPDSIWHSQPGGGFTTTPATVNGAYRPIGGDFNGDGRGDIIWYTPGSGPDRLWTARPTSGFTSTPLTINGTFEPVAGDYTGDGRTDILFYAAGTAADTLWTATPTGGFATTPLTINRTYRPAAGDLNGDGLDDLVWHGPGADPDVLWLARHEGGFASQSLVITGSYLPTVADVTGDGLADVFWYAPGPTPDYLATTTIRR